MHDVCAEINNAETNGGILRNLVDCMERASNGGITMLLSVICMFAGLACLIYGAAVMRARTGTSFYVVWLVLGTFMVCMAILDMSGFLASVPWPLLAAGRVLAAALLILLAATLAMVLSGFRAGGRDAHRCGPSDRRPGSGCRAGGSYILVPGARVREDGASRVLRYRLERAVHFLKENPETIVIVSGGKGSDEPCTEAEVMRDYLLREGIEGSRIISEDRSVNTSQNIRFSADVIRRRGDSVRQAKVGIVTSNFHIFRAVRLAKKAGYRHVYGIPAKSTPFFLPNNVLRESLGIVKDWLCGNL